MRMMDQVSFANVDTFFSKYILDVLFWFVSIMFDSIFSLPFCKDASHYCACFICPVSLTFCKGACHHYVFV